MFNVALVIDGTSETALALQTALILAAASPKILNAFALIDGNKLLKSTGFSGPGGLAGSGVFMQAYEQMLAAMIELSESLMESLTARTDEEKVNLNAQVLVGTPVEILTEKLSANTVLVMGANQSNFDLAKAVSAKVQCPILMVASSPERVPQVTLMTGRNTAELNEVIEIIRHCPVEFSLMGAYDQQKLEERITKFASAA